MHEIVFDEITEGASGLSEFDADDWQRILGSNVIGNHILELRKSLSRMTKALYSQELSHHESLEALLVSQSIPLNKSPGVSPTGIGEVLRRIIGKVVMSDVKKEVTQATCSSQNCTGQVAGVESAIYSMADLFDRDNSAAVLLTDATNVFNCLNCNIFLHNIKVICPKISNFVINC